jgi:hypothetical protein
LCVGLITFSNVEAIIWYPYYLSMEILGLISPDLKMGIENYLHIAFYIIDNVLSNRIAILGLHNFKST